MIYVLFLIAVCLPIVFFFTWLQRRSDNKHCQTPPTPRSQYFYPTDRATSSSSLKTLYLTRVGRKTVRTNQIIVEYSTQLESVEVVPVGTDEGKVYTEVVEPDNQITIIESSFTSKETHDSVVCVYSASESLTEDGATLFFELWSGGTTYDECIKSSNDSYDVCCSLGFANGPRVQPVELPITETKM